jgi:hypothetical protein
MKPTDSKQLENLMFGEPRNRVEFPLYVEFELIDPIGETIVKRAGFRDWNHYLAYAVQMWERNKVKVRHPKEISEPLH